MQQQSIPAQPLLKRIPLLLVYLVCGIAAVYVLLPLLTMVVGSLRTTGELQDQPFGIPAALHWENYIKIFVGGSFWQQLLNSLFTTLTTDGIYSSSKRIPYSCFLTSPNSSLPASVQFRKWQRKRRTNFGRQSWGSTISLEFGGC